MTEPSLDTEPIEEVKGILLVDSLESLLEKDAERFIEEEDESVETRRYIRVRDSP